MGKLGNEEDKQSSHEHSLELTSLCQTGKALCSECKMNIVAGEDYYTCKTCGYLLHHACCNVPRSIRLLADPFHDLNLIPLNSFECKACGLQGSGFAYNCSICLLNYHTLCSQLPHTKTHSSHPHILKLEFSPPYINSKSFRCDICGNPGSDQWLYRCDGCEFDAHVTCAKATPKPQSQPQNPPSPASQAPLFNSTGTSINHNVVQPSGNYINQSQAQNLPVPACGGPTMSANRINTAGPSTYAPQCTTYVCPNPSMRPSGHHTIQMGGYGFSQGPFVRASGMSMAVPQGTQGVSYPNQTGLGRAQGILGTGMAGVMGAGICTGFGEGMGQEAARAALGVFDNDDSGSSDQIFWN